MPGDPKRCREHAKRCWALASEITNPVLKESLLDAAQRWAVLAAELETIHSLLEPLEECEKKAGQLRMALGASGRIKHCEFEEASGELPHATLFCGARSVH